MTTQVPACNVAPQAPAYDFQPSYNAVQLNLKQPTLNVAQPQPQMQTQMPADATKCWNA